MTKLSSLIIIVLLSLTLQSCFTIESFHYIESQPQNVTQIKVKDTGKYGDIETPQYSMLVKTYNTIAGIDSSCVQGMFFPPLASIKHKGEADNASQKRGEMYIDIGLLEKDSYTAVHLGNAEIFYLNKSYILTRPHRDLHLKIQLQEGVWKEYRWTRLVFPMSNFDPKNEFILSLKVLKQDGSESGSHLIEYKPKEMHETGGYGERGC